MERMCWAYWEFCPSEIGSKCTSLFKSVVDTIPASWVLCGGGAASTGTAGGSEHGLAER